MDFFSDFTIQLFNVFQFQFIITAMPQRSNVRQPCVLICHKEPHRNTSVFAQIMLVILMRNVTSARVSVLMVELVNDHNIHHLNAGKYIFF